MMMMMMMMMMMYDHDECIIDRRRSVCCECTVQEIRNSPGRLPRETNGMILSHYLFMELLITS